MQLQGLPGGDAQAAFGELPAQLIQAKPLGRLEVTPGDTQPHHELVVGLQLAALALGATVAIVLLVDAVKLHQQGIVARYRTSNRLLKAAGNVTAQVVAAGFQLLVVVQGRDVLTQITASIDHCAHSRQ